jgi:EpsI family protein
MSWLSRFNSSPADVKNNPPPAPERSAASHAPRRDVADFAVIAMLLIVAAIPVLARPGDVGLARDLKMLPSRVGAWRMASVSTTPAAGLFGIREDLVGAYSTPTGVRTFAGVDDEIVLVYENSSPVRLRLYVGYYRRQDEGRELSGDAGQVLAAASKPVSLTVGFETIEAREVVRALDGAQHGILYWYDINGRIVSDTYRAKAYTAWDGLTRQRTNGAVVMIAWEGTPAASADGRAQAISFARELVPILRDYFKG